MGRIVTGQVKTPDPAKGYIAYYPGFQANTDTSLKDRSGKGNDAVFNSLTTGEAWVTSNRFSSPSTASHHASFSKTILTTAGPDGLGWKWNASRKDSLLIHFKGKVTPAAANFMGNANGTSEGGIKMYTAVGGNWGVNFYDAVNVTSVFGTSSVIDASWNANDHSITLVMDGPNNTYSRYVDGVLLDGPLSLSAVTVLEPQASTFDWCIGGSQITAASTAFSMIGFHMVFAPQRYGSPLNVDKLAMRLHRSPTVLIQPNEWPY